MQSENGFSLIEILMALAITGILAVAVPGALAMTSRANILSNEHTVAETLARSQMDYVQSQTYDKTQNPPVYSVLATLPPGGYSVATPLAARLDPKGDGTANDDGLQKITVTVNHGTKTIYTLVDYKVNHSP